MRNDVRTLDGPAFPEGTSVPRTPSRAALIVPGIIAAFVAFGAAAIAVSSATTGAWLTRTVAGQHIRTTSFTLRQLAAVSVPHGYGTEFWAVQVGAILLVAGGVVLLATTNHLTAQRVSLAVMTLGLVVISFVVYLGSVPPSTRVTFPAGTLVFWSKGAAQNLLHGALIAGWTAFLVSVLFIQLQARRSMDRAAESFPLSRI